MVGYQDTEAAIVINNDRTIEVPEELRKIAVQHDHNIETLRFKCPRYWDGHDLSQMNIFINYVCSDLSGGQHIVTSDKILDEDDPDIFYFDWTIHSDVTKVYGPVRFLVCIKKTEQINVENESGEIETKTRTIYHWNSEINDQTYVSEGMEYDVNKEFDQIEQNIIASIHDYLTKLDTQGVTIEIDVTEPSEENPYYNLQITNSKGEIADIQIYQGRNGEDGKDGVIFTPSVSPSGDLSWTNDSGAANPETVNIRGPQGFAGKQGVAGAVYENIELVDGVATTDPIHKYRIKTESENDNCKVLLKHSNGIESELFVNKTDLAINKRYVNSNDLKTTYFGGGVTAGSRIYFFQGKDLRNKSNEIKYFDVDLERYFYENATFD